MLSAIDPLTATGVVLTTAALYRADLTLRVMYFGNC
jgi:hypothetical protein